ncbi:uncharacterized protein TNCV_3670611 [Trichonephila clavipes]|nr:uncharacterized protein TNCV_3670611 [Trichonephila clavipes]
MIVLYDELPERHTNLLPRFGDNHESYPAVIGNCFPRHDSRCRSSVSRPQTVWLQAFPCHLSDQHMTITGTKPEPAFRKQHNISPLRPSLSFGVIPLASQMVVARNQGNTRYRKLYSELSLN